MTKKSHHVVPSENGWCVKESGNSNPLFCSRTKVEATNVGRTISQSQHTELYLHNADGQIARKDSHGHDPYPPKDKK